MLGRDTMRPVLTAANLPTELATILQALGIGSVPDILASTWESSSNARRASHETPFADAGLREACAGIGLLSETAEACLQDAAAIRSSPELLSLAWHGWWVIFHSGLDVRPGIDDWPLPGELLRASAPRLPPLFWAVVLLAGTGLVFAKNRARGVADSVTASTLRDLDLWIHECRLRTGKRGFLELCWLIYHFSGRLFALGRLHFDIRDNDVGFHVFAKPAGSPGGDRSRGGEAPAQIAILAEEGLQFRPDGQFADADRSVAAEPWVSVFTESARGFEGFPARPDGGVSPEKTLLAASGWARIASPNSPVLGVHIPSAGPFHGPMTPEACEESFQAAIPFFRAHFPEHGFGAFTCKSWLLDSQLTRYLSANSNIVRFQRRFRLVPVRGANDSQTIERVYGIPLAHTAEWDWSTAAEDSSLRRILVQHVRAGGRWRIGGGIIPAGDTSAAI